MPNSRLLVGDVLLEVFHLSRHVARDELRQILLGPFVNILFFYESLSMVDDGFDGFLHIPNLQLGFRSPCKCK